MDVFVSYSANRPGARLDWTRLAGRWADVVGPLARAAVQIAAPVGKGAGAGALRGDIRYTKRVVAGSVGAEISTRVPYAPYVIDGTRAHLIEPRNAKVLHFRSGGKDVFARRVNHPGTKPNPFARRAVEGILPLAQRAFYDIVIEQLRGTP